MGFTHGGFLDYALLALANKKQPIRFSMLQKFISRELLSVGMRIYRKRNDGFNNIYKSANRSVPTSGVYWDNLYSHNNDSRINFDKFELKLVKLSNDNKLLINKRSITDNSNIHRFYFDICSNFSSGNRNFDKQERG